MTRLFEKLFSLCCMHNCYSRFCKWTW